MSPVSHLSCHPHLLAFLPSVCMRLLLGDLLLQSPAKEAYVTTAGHLHLFLKHALDWKKVVRRYHEIIDGQEAVEDSDDERD